MVSEKKMCAIYTGLWMVYEGQSLLGLQSIGRYILLFLIVFSLYKSIYVICHYKLEQFMKGLSFLFIMSLVYGIWYYLFGKEYIMDLGVHGFFIVKKSNYLKYLFMSMPVVYVYYDYAKKNVFNEKALFKYVVFLIVAYSILFIDFIYQQSLLLNVEDGLTINVAYRFVPIIPLLFLINKWRMPLVFVCFCFILLGMKRGAIIVGTVYILFFLKQQLKGSSVRRKILAYSQVAMLVGAMNYVVFTQLESSAYMSARIEETMEGKASGREHMYPVLIDNFINNTTPAQFFLGKGAYATIGILGNAAHNDWLEYATNQGFLGIVIFYLFFLWWYKDWKRMYSSKRDRDVATAFGLLLLGSLLISLFSMMSFTPASGICLGYALSHFSGNKGFSGIKKMPYNKHYV